MSTFKDITYKKNDDETWSEWSKRVAPYNDEDKLDYIGETIYAKIYENDKEKAGKITGMLLELGVERLILLLESNELLDAQIEEAYKKEKVDKEKEDEEKEEVEKEEVEENRYDEEDHDDDNQPIVTLTVAEMIEALSKLPPDAKLVMTESGFYSRSPFAEVMLPIPYKVEYDFHGLTIGTQAYTIGHSHQSY